ncbi:MAG: TonB-dependent receptor, partial [Bacteroidia bacterium]|nr:TonB-dependent receptor [Bacteroidia bacterium]
GSYTFGKEKQYTVNLRWNLASGFPFTQTQGYYMQIPFGGISTDYTNQNGNLGIQYADYNKGRLPYYHRLDASAEKRITFKNKTNMAIIASATNVYNRENIFYFERVTNRRINQLPIMPSLGINCTF